MKIYKVGGAVRDELLRIPVTDQDWVVIGSTPAELLKLGYRKVGNDFPVFLHPETQEEYALGRTERKTAIGYTGFDTFFSPDVTLEEDLARRDFTINAMALELNGKIIDPYSGQIDLQKKTLRHITGAFCEDPLRVIRGARFCAKLNFSVAPETIELMCGIARSGELSALKKERLWKEIQKVLETKWPCRFFEVLEECNALDGILPEIAALFKYDALDIPYAEPSLKKHILDSISAGVKAQLTPQAVFALLAQYLSKKPYSSSDKSSLTHCDAINDFCESLRIPTQYKRTAVALAKINPISNLDKQSSVSALVSLLEKTGAYRNPLIFKESLAAYTVEVSLLSIKHRTQYIHPKVILKALESTSKIDTSEFLAKGLKGHDFAKAIRRARIEKLLLLS
jgi:tRNA nucleotidyltransferase (CCA-adding enzyme)